MMIKTKFNLLDNFILMYWNNKFLVLSNDEKRLQMNE